MKLNFAKKKKQSVTVDHFKVVYKDGEWFAKKGKLFPIKLVPTDINKVSVLFSSIENDVYTLWTPKKHLGTSTRKDISFQYWKPLKPGTYAMGHVTEKGEFIVNWKLQSAVNIAEFNRL